MTGRLVVDEHVLVQVVAAQELLVAEAANEVAVVGVDSLVALEFVGACEALRARDKVASVWAVVVVGAQVGAQVARLVVFLRTLVAVVGPLFGLFFRGLRICFPSVRFE